MRVPESQSLEETQFIGGRRKQRSWQVRVREDAIRVDQNWECIHWAGSFYGNFLVYLKLNRKIIHKSLYVSITQHWQLTHSYVCFIYFTLSPSSISWKQTPVSFYPYFSRYLSKTRTLLKHNFNITVISKN